MPIYRYSPRVTNQRAYFPLSSTDSQTLTASVFNSSNNFGSHTVFIDQFLFATNYISLSSFGSDSISFFPITFIIDNFNRADENPVNTYWDGPIYSGQAQLRVISNQLANSATNGNSYWNDLFQQNQEIFITNTVVDTDANHNFGLQTRLSNVGVSPTGYLAYFEPSDSRISIWRTNGTNTKISSDYTHTFSNGHKFKFRSDGDQHVVFINTGSGWVEVLRVTDNTYLTSGYVGVYSDRVNSTARFDDFGGGDGTLYLQPINFVNQNVFGNHTLTIGGSPQNLTGSLYSDADIFGSATITTIIVLPATIYTNINSFGNNNISMILYAVAYVDSDTFGAASISTLYNLLATTYANLSSFGISYIILIIIASVYSDADTFGSHVVTAGTVTLTATLYSDADLFGNDTVYKLVYFPPTSDIVVTGWTDQDGGTTDLYARLDEIIPSDLDYVKVTTQAISQESRFGISASDPGVDDAYTLKYRFGKDGSAQVNVTVSVYQGTTLIASWSHVNISAAWTDYEHTLSVAEISQITDSSLLRAAFDPVRV